MYLYLPFEYICICIWACNLYLSHTAMDHKPMPIAMDPLPLPLTMTEKREVWCPSQLEGGPWYSKQKNRQ